MLGKLDRNFDVLNQTMNLRTERQQLIASNIANADTPNYKARDIDFGKSLQAALAGRGVDPAGFGMTKTVAGHLSGVTTQASRDYLYRSEFQSAVDGNTVEMDAERANFSDNAIRYEASVNFVSSKFRGLLDAMQSPRG